MAIVELQGGVTLTLAIDGSVLTMPKADRDFLFKIVDLMQGYTLPASDADEEDLL